MTSELPITETINAASREIDRLSAREIVEVMNAEDAGIARAVHAEADSIAAAVDAIANALRSGGRLVYLGAGTSGRLGVLDASECPPTFNSAPGQVVGLIAGGPAALTNAVEGAEDTSGAATSDLAQIKFCAKDVLVGIGTSGRTPYVLEGLRYAATLGAVTVGLSCTADSAIAGCCQIAITPIVGPEIVTGSTRLKAGTATKMVLNMLSTGAMVLLGKTYGNLMVDLQAKNQKLRERSTRIVSMLTGLSPDESAQRLSECGGDLKTTVVATRRNVDAESARQRLQEVGGRLRDALE